MKILFILLSISCSLLADELEFTNITSPALHQHFKGLSALEGQAQTAEEDTQMAGVIDALLAYVRPQVEALPAYTNPFFINCTGFFNTQLEKLACRINFEEEASLDKSATCTPERAILRANLNQIRKSHIFLTRAYINWAGGKYQEATNQLYFRLPPTQTASVTASPGESLSASLLPEERTETPPLSKTASESLSVTQTESISKSKTNSLIATKTASRSHSSSQTAMATATPPIVEGARTVAATGVKPHAGLAAQNVPALTWELGRKGTAKMNWSNAKAYCANKGSGWRLPTVWELDTLYQQKSVLGGDYDANYYWSSTPLSGSTDYAWYVYFNYGNVYYSFLVNDSLAVRCVAAP